LSITIALRGFQHLASLTPLQAVQRVLTRLYHGIPLRSTLQPNKTQKKLIRNAEICKRHAAGDSIMALAKAFGISKQRVHQIIAAPDN
jgi:Mor family transcriptional regulator